MALALSKNLALEALDVETNHVDVGGCYVLFF